MKNNISQWVKYEAEKDVEDGGDKTQRKKKRKITTKKSILKIERMR